MLNKMKKILFILILLISVFVFVGCAEITYSVTISDGGARVYDYKVTFDKASPETAQNIILVRTYFEYQKSKNEYADIIFDEETPNEIIYRVSYESQTEYNLAMGITGDEPNDAPMEYTEKGLFRVYEGILLDLDKEDFALYALSYLSVINSASADAFNYDLRENLKSYINNPTISNTANECVIRICTATDVDTVQSLITELSISEVATELAEITYNSLKEMGYDYSKVIATFEYSHVYKSIKGVDPDKTEVVNTDLGKAKVYSWNLDLLGHNEIKVTQQTPNVWAWELIALCVGVVVALIVLLVFFVRRKNFKKSLEHNKIVFSEQTTHNQETTQIQKKDNVYQNQNSQYASWFGYSENHIKNNSDNNTNLNPKDKSDDVFGEYFDNKNSESVDDTDKKDE